jgi:S-adenosylmethionine/arginine decarboxylase-like enzyme
MLNDLGSHKTNMRIVTTETEGLSAKPSPAGVKLVGFEQVATSFAAVQEVHGPEHPLVRPGTDEFNLLDALEVALDTNSVTITGQAAAKDIVGSLHEVAQAEDNNYARSAQHMLAQAGLDTAPVLTPGHVVLHTYEQTNTAIQSINQFAPGTRVGSRAVNALFKDAQDPFHPHPRIYKGRVSGVIVECLEEAATQPETLFGSSAKAMVEASTYAVDFPQPYYEQPFNAGALITNMLDHAQSWWPSILHEVPLLHQSH